MLPKELQEKVRSLAHERIQEREVTVSDLARSTEITPSHMYNFAYGRRGLSIQTLDALMRAMGVSTLDFERTGRPRRSREPRDVGAIRTQFIPVVEARVAALNRQIFPESALGLLPFSSDLLESMRGRCSEERRRWDRFVALRNTGDDAALMLSVLPLNAIVVIDRHYTSPEPYIVSERTIYAVFYQNRLRFRYVTRIPGSLILSTASPEGSLEAFPLATGRTGSGLLVGRLFSYQTYWGFV